jgi:hypothetical protein
MLDEDMKKYNLIRLTDERILGKAEDIAKYLRYCLKETFEQYLADGLEWEDETEPVIGDLYEYIKMVESCDKAELYTLSECAMSPSNIIISVFREAK